MGLIKGTVNLVAMIASAFTGLLALAIVIYTATQVSSVKVNSDLGNLTDETFCALGKPTDSEVLGVSIDTGSSNCLMLEILGGITIGIAIVISIIQCYTCNLCGLGGLLDFIFAILAALAWLAASIIITNAYTVDSNNQDGYEDKREIVMIMCWVEFALFLSIVVATIMKCASCCGGRSKSAE